MAELQLQKPLRIRIVPLILYQHKTCIESISEVVGRGAHMDIINWLVYI